MATGSSHAGFAEAAGIEPLALGRAMVVGAAVPATLPLAACVALLRLIVARREYGDASGSPLPIAVREAWSTAAAAAAAPVGGDGGDAALRPLTSLTVSALRAVARAGAAVPADDRAGVEAVVAAVTARGGAALPSGVAPGIVSAVLRYAASDSAAFTPGVRAAATAALGVVCPDGEGAQLIQAAHLILPALPHGYRVRQTRPPRGARDEGESTEGDTADDKRTAHIYTRVSRKTLFTIAQHLRQAAICIAIARLVMQPAPTTYVIFWETCGAAAVPLSGVRGPGGAAVRVSILMHRCVLPPLPWQASAPRSTRFTTRPGRTFPASFGSCTASAAGRSLSGCMSRV